MNPLHSSPPPTRIPELNVLADRELARRSPKVALTTVPVVVLVTMITDLREQALEYTGFFAAILLLMGLYRLWVSRNFKPLYARSPRAWMHRFSCVVLFSAGAFGVALPTIFFSMGADWTLIISLLTTAAIAASATSSLSPRQGLFRAFVGLTLLPLTITLLIFGNLREMGLGLLILFFVGQLLVLGRYFHKEFWSGLRNAHILKERAASLEKANAEVEAANKAKGEFLANMSHEIRTPLNGILGLTDLVLDTELNEQQDEYLRIVRNSSQHLMRVINEVLDFSKIEAGRLELESSVFSLTDLLRKVSVAGELGCKENGNRLFMQIENDFPREVVGDSHRLRQVLSNLVSNAVKFTKLGTITIQGTVNHRQDGLVAFTISIEDSGIGISKEAQAQIFQAFKQADGSTTRNFSGTGLGLAICHQLVDLMGGKITLTSELDKGSRFCVHLALPEAVGSRQLPENGGAHTSRPDPDGIPAEEYPDVLAGLKVLLVEDNTVNAKLATRLLEKSGMTVVWAENGQEAVTEYLKQTFDLVLMDIQMPILDGFGATAAIREAEDGSQQRVPIIALTAHAMDGYREKCLAADMDDYLTKPMQPKKLRDTLERWSPRKLNPAP